MSFKKPSNKILAGIAAIAATAILVPALVFAAAGGPHGMHAPGAMVRHIAKQLDLTPQQIQDIRGIFKTHQQELQTELTGVEQARTQLFDSIHGETYDEAAIRSASACVAQAETQLNVTRGKMVSEVRAVLTPDQQTKATELLAKVREHGHGFMDHLRAHLADPLAGL
ncbi:MAG TPA: Spy/CpxP family protein refolding chaperone [Thermoanaerobaculia bacterium]